MRSFRHRAPADLSGLCGEGGGTGLAIAGEGEGGGREMAEEIGGAEV